MLLKELRRICDEERKVISEVNQVIEAVLQKNSILAAKEKETPGTVTGLLDYLSAMGMVSVCNI